LFWYVSDFQHIWNSPRLTSFIFHLFTVSDVFTCISFPINSKDVVEEWTNREGYISQNYIIYKNNQTLSKSFFFRLVRNDRKACQKERHLVLNVVLFLFVWWVMIFWILIFWIYPRSWKPSMGRFVQYFMQNHFHRFPMEGFSGRLHNPHSRNRSRQNSREMRKKKISTNKQQICCCQLQYLSFGVRPLRLLRQILTSKCLPIRSFDWSNSRQLLSRAKRFWWKNTNKIWRANWFSSVGLSW
jgi:hypothetical protein